jgi:copper(I)-binding protein
LMKKISIIILLMICLSLLLLTGCEEIGITPEIDIGNSEYQGDISDTGTVDTGGTVSTEGAGTVSNINIDKTPPEVTITLPGTGEYVLNESITATWSATDALSGVVSPVSGSVSIDTSSVGTKTITLPAGTAKDKAGNNSLKVTKSYKVIKTVIEVDTTKPVITGSRAPLPNSFGWNNTDVTVSFSCADTGAVQSGIATNTVAGKTVITEGKDQSVTNTGVCIDAAGNTADPVTISNINIDKTPPVVTITLPGTSEYVLNQSITATWSATDALSGVVSPVSGSVSIDTSSVGTKTITLPAGTAMDKAGNSSLKVTKSYSVIADTEDPVIVDSEDPEMVYPQKWVTGDGTVENPWANDCIKKALDFAPAGGTIFLKAGYYILSDVIGITKKINIIGEGRNNTIIITANETGFSINEIDYVSIKNLTIDGDAQTEGSHSCIAIANSDYVSLEDIEVKNAGYYGMDLFQNNYLICKDIYAHDNYRHGVHPGTDTVDRGMFNIYRDIYAWGNGVCGFADRGPDNGEIWELNNTWDNIQAWDNGQHGIRITGQKNCVLSNSLASGNGAVGIWMYNIEDSNIHDCVALLNTDSGIEVSTSNNINLTNIVSKNNHFGILTQFCDDILLTNCQLYDDREPQLQDYGIYLYKTNVGISLVNCKLSPNEIKDIYNPNGAVVTVITEKMLAKF